MLDRSRIAITVLVLTFGVSCDSSTSINWPGPDLPTTGDSGASVFALRAVTNGSEQLLPHRIAELDTSGAPTGQIIDLLTFADVSVGNPVLATASFPTTATLPNGRPGNQYLRADFNAAVDPESVFDLALQAPGLTGTLRVLAFDPASGQTTDVPARIFVGGVTAVADPAGARLERWVAADLGSGRLVLASPDAAGFPGKSPTLADPRTVLIVADADGDLSTLETFPTGVEISLEITSSLRSVAGEILGQGAFVSTAVGADTITPEVAFLAGGGFAIEPADGATDVDPATDVIIQFTESVQPTTFGVLEGHGPSSSTGSIVLGYGPPTQRNEMLFSVIPLSTLDLRTYILRPAFAFPGAAPGGPMQNAFNQIDLTVTQGAAIDLAASANALITQVQTTFLIGIGSGIANAPVVPDAIYLGRGGAGGAGLSVVDLNGFGASSGNPVSSPSFPLEGESRFKFNPNVAFQPGLRPPLTPGTTTVDGGSAGVFTLTLDSSLQDRLTTAAATASVHDIHIGHPLDVAFNNSPPPFGCQAGGGNICALDGLKVIKTRFSASGILEPDTLGAIGHLNIGYGNIVSWAPHPNPPALIFPPTCIMPNIGNQEPTSIDSTAAGMQNLLVPGNPFPNPATMTPPTGLLSLRQNAFFQGPSVEQTTIFGCRTYMIRGQVGHFLYVADRANAEIVVLNSNRMTVIERISVSDPVDMAMSPNLDYLAVSNYATGTVSFISTNPSSFQLHQVTRTISVGAGASGIAWQSESEDIIVCNELDKTISIIAATTQAVRRTLSTGTLAPFDVALTPRQTGFSFDRSVYFGYILTREGVVALFESGPNGVNGWGYDDIIGVLPYRFAEAKAIQPEPGLDGAGVYIAHERPIDPATGAQGAVGDGAISLVQITSGSVGLLPLAQGLPPHIRSMTFEVTLSMAESTGQLSGTPVDLAFDDLSNIGGTPGVATSFSSGAPLPGNNKGMARVMQGQARSTNIPRFLFAAVPGSGVVDVLAIELAGAPRFDVNSYQPGVQSIPAPGTSVLASYFRQ